MENNESCASAFKESYEEAAHPKRGRALKPDAQAFDEIRIRTVPRYKSSGLSGDEWRISAITEFYRKGVKVHEEYTGSVESASKFLAYHYANAVDNGKAFFAGEKDICDQEGCSEKATIRCDKKVNYCSRGCGEKASYQSPEYRLFCDKHATRGDCGIDDADDNYVKTALDHENIISSEAEEQTP